MNFLVQVTISLSLELDVVPVLISTAINFALAYPYFFLLGRTQGSSLYMVIMVSGVFTFLGLIYFL